MVIKTFHIDKTNNKLDTWMDENLARQFIRPKGTFFKINLIEISNIISPSNLLITIEHPKKDTTLIYLHRFRKEIQFQNGTYFWDTSKYDFLNINIENDAYFSLAVSGSDEDFAMALFGETDQRDYSSEEKIIV